MPLAREYRLSDFISTKLFGKDMSRHLRIILSHSSTPLIHSYHCFLLLRTTSLTDEYDHINHIDIQSNNDDYICNFTCSFTYTCVVYRYTHHILYNLYIYIDTYKVLIYKPNRSSVISGAAGQSPADHVWNSALLAVAQLRVLSSTVMSPVSMGISGS